ncbi:hypothetical protein [Bifidobacterium simiarum]|uniref:hypothetical protein n=1 Tax=Bifidobacterium simiarum TaxID=2045441 RepID=UPI001BDBB446|nr:hypothetical protein [Bifidobacterium simiarum]MBT1167277.1 hypothetical protein [Bifidobacterium simiarum]
MNGYWLGVATPFLLAAGATMVWLFARLCHALGNWAMRKAHGALIQRRQLPVDDANPGGEWKGLSVEPRARRFTEALVRDDGRFIYVPVFGWIVVIVRDRKTEP